jgi:alkylated DNA nucleotide flippase Atl1
MIYRDSEAVIIAKKKEPRNSSWKSFSLKGRIRGRNPNPVKASCHRVVGQMARLARTNMAAIKRENYLKEGISFTDEIVSDFKKVRVYLKNQ